MRPGYARKATEIWTNVYQVVRDRKQIVEHAALLIDIKRIWKPNLVQCRTDRARHAVTLPSVVPHWSVRHGFLPRNSSHGTSDV
jgi:hypothetical protein